MCIDIYIDYSLQIRLAQIQFWIWIWVYIGFDIWIERSTGRRVIDRENQK